MTRDEVFEAISLERDYQKAVGNRPKEIGSEIALCQRYLNSALEEWAGQDNKSSNNPPQYRMLMRDFRRIAANMVRVMEKYGNTADQQDQKARLNR